MEKENSGNAIGIASAESASLPFGNGNNAEQQNQVDDEQQCSTEETKAFTDGTEYKVRSLLGNKVIARLRTIQQAFAGKPARADGNFGLAHIVIGSGFFFCGCILDGRRVVRIRIV